jgi:hypothetical protein
MGHLPETDGVIDPKADIDLEARSLIPYLEPKIGT